MKKQRTRKERTLRRLAVLGLCLLLFGQFYGVTPKTAQRETEFLFNTGRTTLIWEGEPPVEMNEPTRLLLTVNDKVLLLTQARFAFKGGWQRWDENATACTGEGSIHGGLFRVFGAEDENICYLFGRVDDPAAKTLRIRLGGWVPEPRAPGYQVSEPPETWIEYKTLDIPRFQWFHAEGGTYFIQPVLTSKEAPLNLFVEAYVDLLDQEGRVLDSLGPISR